MAGSTLVVFGSMANKIGALVAGGSDYYADKIVLSDSSGSVAGFSTAPISLTTADLETILGQGRVHFSRAGS